MRRVLKGMTGAAGCAAGPVVHIQIADAPLDALQSTDVAPVERFQAAQAVVVAQLTQISAELRAEGKAGEAAIFDGQALLANDPLLTAEVSRLLAAESYALPSAVRAATETLAATLSSLDDSYLRERAADVRAVGTHISAVLNGNADHRSLPPGAIVLAHELTPAWVALLRQQDIAGIATVLGAPSDHVAILARAFGIPTVVGLGAELLTLPDHMQALLIADDGQLIAAPEATDHEAYQARCMQQRVNEQRREHLLNLPAQTSDGYHVELWANIGHPDEADLAYDQGAHGIGLLRTEFLFLGRTAPPNEAEQYQAYVKVLRAMQGRPVVIRTLDIGGDKPVPYGPFLPETNPFLGWRGIRRAIYNPDLFRTQLRALLRAAVEGDLRIMLPLVTTPADVAWARQELAAAADALQQEGVSYRADMPLGMMVETPAAALTLDRFAQQIQFCSVGSNDLAQYMLAVDRSATALVERYPPDDPAVWRLIRHVVDEARRLGLELSICGELAADPDTSIALVGLGIEKLSITPAALLTVKEALRSSTRTEAQHVAIRRCDAQEIAAEGQG